MSYIEDVLHGKQSNDRIAAYLKAEGFEIGQGPMKEDGFTFSTTGRHTVYVTVIEDRIKIYIDYAEADGGTGNNWWFERDNFEDFKEKYKEALGWAKGYI